jgi:chromosomal replication initiation ATPase DnaA
MSLVVNFVGGFEMKANEIVSILEEDFNLYYKTVLISGNWGVGKTYYVKQFLEEKTNSIYISLFGKNNIDDIKMDIYGLSTVY